MKKALTLALCLAAQIAVAQCPGTWQPMPSGLNTDLRALHFPTAKDGWAVGAAGKIIHSADGGLTWSTPQTSGTANTLQGVHFTSASTGWAVGHRGIILKTSNGGSTWVPQSSNTETDLFDVWFTDAQNGWVVGACGLILRTTDGGQQWAQVSSGKDYNIRQIKVLPNGKGFTTTTGAALIATANSGANWAGQTTAPRNFRGMDLDASGLAFAASKDGALLKSTDYGGTWAAATGPTGGGNWEVLSMVSANHLVLAGQQGKVFRSTDGGASWADFHTGLDSTDIFGLQMSGDTLGWAVGERGRVFRFVCDLALLPDMVPVPGGTFDMGCFKPNTICDPKENPVHVVALPDFNIGKYEVTQAEWEAIMGDISPDSIPFAKNCGGTCPMEKITWYGAAVYCNRLSEQNGLAPCYYADTAFAQIFGKNGNTWNLPNSGPLYWKKEADGYRLPTEAEWEYAARGGAQSQGYRYAGGNGPNGVAWHKTISSGNPHPVGQKTPNELGLHDMSGNVWELCWDWYAAYSGAAACSPIGPNTGTKRLSRGGSFDNLEDLARVSYRPFFPEPDKGVFDIGFRLAQGKVSPNCTNVLVQPTNGATNVPTNTVLRWASSNICVSGYRLSIGTAPGGSDILNNVVATDTFYQLAAALPAGQQVYVRVVPYNGAGAASGCGEFSFVTYISADACAGSPYIIPPAESCYETCIYCDFNGYTGSTAGYVSNGIPIGGFCSMVQNDQWLGFIAGADTARFTVTPSNCLNGMGLQISLHENCNAPPIACDPHCGWCGEMPVSFKVPLISGTNYYLLIDGFSGDVCDFTLVVDPPSAVRGLPVGDMQPIEASAVLCSGSTVTLSVPNVVNAGTYEWSSTTQGVTFNGKPGPVKLDAPDGKSVQVYFPSGMAGNVEVCVAASNSCYPGPKQCKTIAVLPAAIASAGSDTTTCSGQSLTLTASGGLTYQWSDGGPATAQWTLTPTATKTYTVTVTSADGCTAVDSVKVTIQSDLNCSLVAHYNFDGNARDTSGNNNHGIPTGFFDYSKDRFGDCGQAIHLNGFYQKGWVRVPSSNSLKFNANKQMTLALWVELDELAGMTGLGSLGLNGFHMLVAKGGDGLSTPNGFYYGLNSIGSNLNIGGQNSGPVINLGLSHPPIHPNYTSKAWKHIAIVATPDSMRLYLDGTLIHKAASNTNFTDADTKDLLFGIMDGKNGATPFWYPLKGSLDDLRLYNRALSPAEINALYTLPNDNPNPAPAATLVAAKTTLCPGETATLTASPAQAGYTYTWYRDSTLISGATGSAYAAEQPGLYQVRIAATIGCDSLSVPLQITSATPNISAFADTLTCASPVIVLQGNSATPGVTYAWSGPNGFTSGLQNPPVNVAGTYILTVQDPANACSARDTVVVEAAVGVPSATITTPNGTLLTCTVDSVRLVAPAGAGYTYVWSGGSATNSQTLIAKTPGTYTLTVTNATNGCSATASVIVEKNTATPSAAAAGGVLPCQNPFVVLQGNSGTSGVTYSWSGPSGFAANQQNPPVSVAGTYTLTVRNTLTGCTSTATALVLSPQLPTASITAPSGQQLTCILTNLPLQASGGNQYAWAGPGGFTANGQQPTVNTPGAYTVTVTSTANGCTNTATTTIGLNQTVPLVSATTATLTCAQPTAVLSGSSNASGATYVWGGPGGFAANGQQPTVNTSGTYTVTATNPANGCTGTTTTTVSENKTAPAAAIATPGGTSLTCLVSSVSLQASGGGGYIWAGPNGFSASGQQQMVNSPGAYTVTVTSATNGCTAPATVIVSENKNAPSLSAVGGQLSCAQFQAVLQATSSAAGATFKWAGPGGFLANGQQPTVSSAGTYTCTVTDPANGCTATQQVVVAPALVLSPSIAPVKAICPGVSVGLKASGGYASYRWSSGQLTDSITVNQPGVYIVTVTDANQCVGTASVSVTAAPSPQPIIEGKLAFCAGSSTTLSVAPSGLYLWNGPSGFVFSGQKPAVNVAGTYTVTVTNSEGCTGTQSVTVSGYPAALALLLVSEDTVCAGEAVTFTAGGGKEYRFWLDGVAQGGFSSNKTFVLNNPANGATVAVQIMDTNNCPDSTAAGDGPGREPISISVLPQPNLSAAFVTQIPTCPEDSVRLLMNLPNLPNGTYTVHWQVDNLPPSAASVLLINKLGSISLPPLPPGPHTCKVLSAEVMGSGCASTWPTSSSTLSFTVQQPAVTPLDTTICYTQSVVVGGKVFNQTGMYAEVLKTATGCDSTVVLDLKTVTEFQQSVSARFCPNGYYLFYGDTLRMEVMQYPKLIPSGIPGCSTRVLLDLKMVVPEYEPLNKKTCPGDSVVVHGKSYPEGKHEIEIKSVLGCDSLIIWLTVTEHPFSAFFPKDEERACRDEVLTLAPDVQNCPGCKYEWRSPVGASFVLSNAPSIFAAPPMTTTYSVKVTMKEGQLTCSKTDTMTLVVIQPEFTERDTQICAGEALTWCGKSITQAGEYPCTFPTVEGCDSTVTLKVTVFEDKFDAANDSLSVALGVSEQVYDVAKKILQNDLYSGVYDIQIVQQPRIDSVVLEDAGQTLRYLLRAGPRFGVDSFQYALCPPNGCPEACDWAWVRVRLQNGDLDWVQANMPNLITPDEMDGQNDVFDPLGFAKAHGVSPDGDRVQFFIINRWGEVVHRPYPYKPWDGLKGNEKPLPQATYYYRLTFEIGEEVYELKGAVNLLK